MNRNMYPKTNKPKQYHKHLALLTLLNCVYKMASGCIANRIKHFLEKLIHKNLTGFIKDRYIEDNIRLIYVMMHYIILYRNI